VECAQAATKNVAKTGQLQENSAGKIDAVNIPQITEFILR
jgi:hypothetical protein